MDDLNVQSIRQITIQQLLIHCVAGALGWWLVLLVVQGFVGEAGR